MAQKQQMQKQAPAKPEKNGKASKNGAKATMKPAAVESKPMKNDKAAKAAKVAPAKPEKPAKKKKGKAAPIPKGFTSVSAHLVLNDAAKALDFYAKAFGAKPKAKIALPDGRICHAEMQIGDCRVMLCDDFPEWNGNVARAASALSATPVTLHLYVKNADKAFAQAVEAGCQVIMPLMDAFWGDRYGKLKDPFGHEWSIATHTKDLSSKQIMKAMEQAMSAGGCEGGPDGAPSGS